MSSLSTFSIALSLSPPGVFHLNRLFGGMSRPRTTGIFLRPLYVPSFCRALLPPSYPQKIDVRSFIVPDTSTLRDLCRTETVVELKSETEGLDTLRFINDEIRWVKRHQGVSSESCV